MKKYLFIIIAFTMSITTLIGCKFRDSKSFLDEPAIIITDTTEQYCVHAYEKTSSAPADVYVVIVQRKSDGVLLRTLSLERFSIGTKVRMVTVRMRHSITAPFNTTFFIKAE